MKAADLIVLADITHTPLPQLLEMSLKDLGFWYEEAVKWHNFKNKPAKD